MKLSYSYFAFFIFLIFNFFDPVFYGVYNRFGIYVPVGFIGILFSFILLARLFFIRNKNDVKISLIALLFLAPVISVFASDYGAIKDIYGWFKLSGNYAFGVFFALYLFCYGKKDEKVIVSCFVFLIVFLLGFITRYDLEGDENYLRIATSISFLSILSLSIVESSFWRVLIFVSSVVCLYVIGSRFALLSYVLSVIFVSLYFSKSIKLILVFVFITAAMFITHKIALNAYLQLDSVHSNRFLRLLFESESDTSLNGRKYLSEWAWDIFRENIWFGKYKYYRAMESEGSYAHNFISYWAELGVLGILMTVSVFFINAKALFTIRIDFNNPNKIKRALLKFLALSILIQMLGFLFAKSYVWEVTYFVTGMSFSYLILRKYENNLPPSTAA